MNIIQYWISVHTTLYFYTAIDFVYQCNLDCSKLNICQLDIFSVNIDSFLVSTLKTPNIYTEILFVHLCPSFFISLLDSALYTRESQSFKTFTKEGERTKKYYSRCEISPKIPKDVNIYQMYLHMDVCEAKKTDWCLLTANENPSQKTSLTNWLLLLTAPLRLLGFAAKFSQRNNISKYL